MKFTVKVCTSTSIFPWGCRGSTAKSFTLREVWLPGTSLTLTERITLLWPSVSWGKSDVQGKSLGQRGSTGVKSITLLGVCVPPRLSPDRRIHCSETLALREQCVPGNSLSPDREWSTVVKSFHWGKSVHLVTISPLTDRSTVVKHYRCGSLQYQTGMSQQLYMRGSYCSEIIQHCREVCAPGTCKSPWQRGNSL